jgi:hypothetical protein
MIIYSYRGLDGERRQQLAEDSLEAYRWAFECGFGAATDVRQAQLESLLQLAEKTQSGQIALQVEQGDKAALSDSELMAILDRFPSVHSRLLLYGLLPRLAAQIKAKFPAIDLAASVCHSFDVARYQSSCQHALLTLNELLTHSELYRWAWLEEWDRIGGDGQSKAWFELCASDLRDMGMKLAIASPELHANDGHPDGTELSRVENRWRGILACKPDAVCTTYPARLSWLTKS